MKHRLGKYGMTLDQYNSMLEEQDNTCPLCERTFSDLLPTNIDHCHDQGHVREILCQDCNKGLGWFRDNPESLRRAADYLMQHRKEEAS